jgi:hypothetical protein
MPSHPGGTTLGKQKGDAPGWQIPTYGNGSAASQGTVANFSAAWWFLGTAYRDSAAGHRGTHARTAAGGGWGRRGGRGRLG